MITAMTLVDGTREMELLPRDDAFVQLLDVPFPAVREVVEDHTDDDGEDDTTEVHGGTSCSIELLVTSDPGGIVDELGRFLHPRSRPYLHVTDDEWDQVRRLRLRVAQSGAPRGVDLARNMRRILPQWKVPDGIWETVDLVEETVNADVTTSSGGLELPVTLPVALTATTSTGASQISNVGGTPVHHVTRLYGPCTGPSLANETLDEEITFTDGLVLGSGEYVEIDTRNKTAYLNGSSSASRLSYIDYTVTTWWQIEPGDQDIRYAPTSVTGAAAAVITYRPGWLT